MRRDHGHSCVGEAHGPPAGRVSGFFSPRQDDRAHDRYRRCSWLLMNIVRSDVPKGVDVLCVVVNGSKSYKGSRLTSAGCVRPGHVDICNFSSMRLQSCCLSKRLWLQACRHFITTCRNASWCIPMPKPKFPVLETRQRFIFLNLLVRTSTQYSRETGEKLPAVARNNLRGVGFRPVSVEFHY